MRRDLLRALAAPALGTVIALAWSLPAAAAIQVNNPNDEADGECAVDCSLRDAAAIAATTAEPVVVPAGTYRLTLDNITLTGVTIQGAGARSTVIDGTNAVRAFRVTGGVNNVSGVMITRGAGAGIQTSNGGGGILVEAGTLNLVSSAVIGNQAELGGGIAMVDGVLNVSASTIAGNLAQIPSTAGSSGGGLFLLDGTVTFVNSTISGNTARDDLAQDGSQGGGIYINTGDVQLRNVTVARNQAASGGGVLNSDGSLAMDNTIVADSLAGGACGRTGGIQGDHNLDDDNTCGLSAAAGDKPGVDPQLGLLGNNGGPTNTHRPAPASPAVNGGDTCEAADQRGIARPQLGACDIGALEYSLPRLTVVKRVVNDQGGTAAPGDFSIHLRRAGADVAGSPQPGTAAGRTYTLAPGAYSVGEDEAPLYVASFAGACAADGTATLLEGQFVTCTVTNDDRTPVVGQTVNAVPKRGTVKIKLPGRRRFRRLEEGEQLPVGTVVDTLAGRVTLTAAANKRGGTATADFYDGVFKLGQTKGSRPITVLRLVEKLSCAKTKQASATAKKKKKRRLWGDGRGRFRTKGRHSAATVVGTKWLVEDRCTLTLTRVRRGRVKVRDFVKKKTVTVKAGKRYIARAGR